MEFAAEGYSGHPVEHQVGDLNKSSMSGRRNGEKETKPTYCEVYEVHECPTDLVSHARDSVDADFATQDKHDVD